MVDFTRLPKREDVRSGLNGRNASELAEADATARRLRGQFRFVRGFNCNNVTGSGLLPVLTHGFGREHLTPRAVSAVIRAKHRRRVSITPG
jgi:hypothetical protein